MKLFLLCLFLLTAVLSFGGPKSTDLPEALTGNLITLHATAGGGLGKDNLTCLLKNKTSHEVTIRIPPGLHFKADENGAQDLLTIMPQLLVLNPGSEQTIILTGYCMNIKNFSPRTSSVYSFNGFAPESLHTLSDSLARYKVLTDDYGQMFVWAITNKYEISDVWVEKKLMKPAANIMKFVAQAASLPLAKVFDRATAAKSKGGAPAFLNSGTSSVNVFSKRAILAFHNPTDAMASFKIYDDKGAVKHVLFENKKIRHGLTEYTFGINDIIRHGASPVYYAKVVSSTGKVLAEMKVDNNTEEIPIKPRTQDLILSFVLQKGVKAPYLNVYLENGTLVENFKQYEYLPMGNYNISVTLRHLYPADTKFITKLEDAKGVVYAQMPEPKK